MGSSAHASIRQPVTFDPATRSLCVGTTSTIVPEVPDSNEAMLRGYLAVVAKARGNAVASLTEVRQHDVAVLAQLLDLDDVDLEARFVRLLGMTPAMAADTRRRIAMHRAVLAAAGITVGLLMISSGASAGAALTGAATSVAPAVISIAAAATSHAETTSPAETTSHAAATSQTTPLPSAAPTPDTQDQSASQGDVEIGDALVIERGTQPDDPNVQVGDAVTYGR